MNDSPSTSKQFKPLDLCNKNEKPNPIKGLGPLGHQYDGRMSYEGGDREDLVKLLQEMLIELGPDYLTFWGRDGKFGDETEKAVKRFQEEHKDFEGKRLRQDGLIGPKTADALNRAMVGRWYEFYQTPKDLMKETRLITLTEKAFKNGISVDPEEVKEVKVATVERVAWIDLQTVDELGQRVGNVELVLRFSDGAERRIQTNATGYHREKGVPYGEIKVMLPDGTPAKYISNHKETDVILHTRFATWAITHILAARNLTSEEKQEYQRKRELYERRKDTDKVNGRKRVLDKTTGEHTGQKGEVKSRRAQVRAVDNLALVAGFNKQGEVKISELIKVVLREWLEDYHPTTVADGRGYIVIVYHKREKPPHQLTVYDSDGQELESLSMKSALVKTGLVGAYSEFEWQEGVNLFVDMTYRRASVPVEGREKEIVDIEEILTKESLGKFLKILRENPNKLLILYFLGTKMQPVYAGLHGGTGTLEPYGKDESLNARIHNRNMKTVQTVVKIYNRYINDYAKKVEKAQNEDEIRKLGPPLSVYQFPTPCGAPLEFRRNLFDANVTSSLRAWSAIAARLDKLANEHMEGALFFRVDAELTSKLKGKKGLLEGEGAVKIKSNIDFGTDGVLKKPLDVVLTGEAKGGLKPGKWIPIPIEAGVEHEFSVMTGEGKTCFKLKGGPLKKQWGFEVCDDGTRKVTGPFGVVAQFNNKTGEMGYGIDLELGEDGKQGKVHLGLYLQSIRNDTIVAYFSRAPGFFERRGVSELISPTTQWVDLYPDEQSRLDLLGWNESNADKFNRQMPQYWDDKHNMPLNEYPKSTKKSWHDLNGEQQEAVRALGIRQYNWQKVWREIAK